MLLKMRTLPSDFILRGEFEFAGVEIHQMAVPFQQSSLMMEHCGYSPLQFELFQGFQKSMDRYNQDYYIVFCS